MNQVIIKVVNQFYQVKYKCFYHIVYCIVFQSIFISGILSTFYKIPTSIFSHVHHLIQTSKLPALSQEKLDLTIWKWLIGVLFISHIAVFFCILIHIAASVFLFKKAFFNKPHTPIFWFLFIFTQFCTHTHPCVTYRIT